MEELTDITYKAIDRYFNILRNLGYSGRSNTDKLLVFLFIEELLSNDFKYCIDLEDYNIITDALYCLYGSSCLFDFPEYEVFDSIYRINSPKVLFITDSSIPIITEDLYLSIVKA